MSNQPITVLEVNGISYQAKGSFMFETLANKKYSSTNRNNDKIKGFNTIYQELLDESIEALVKFWDCAVAHLAQRPSYDAIVEALTKKVEEEGTTVNLLRGALEVLDESAFFKRNSQKFWNNGKLAVKLSKTEEEKEEAEEANEMLRAMYKDLMGYYPGEKPKEQPVQAPQVERPAIQEAVTNQPTHSNF